MSIHWVSLSSSRCHISLISSFIRICFTTFASGLHISLTPTTFLLFLTIFYEGKVYRTRSCYFSGAFIIRTKMVMFFSRTHVTINNHRPSSPASSFPSTLTRVLHNLHGNMCMTLCHLVISFYECLCIVNVGLRDILRVYRAGSLLYWC